MGKATDVAEVIAGVPLTSDEIDARRIAERQRNRTEATLDGRLVEREVPTVAPVPVFQARPSTWD